MGKGHPRTNTQGQSPGVIACSTQEPAGPGQAGKVSEERAFLGQGTGPWNPRPLVLLLLLWLGLRSALRDGDDLRSTLLKTGCILNKYSTDGNVVMESWSPFQGSRR